MFSPVSRVTPRLLRRALALSVVAAVAVACTSGAAGQPTASPAGSTAAASQTPASTPASSDTSAASLAPTDAPVDATPTDTIPVPTATPAPTAAPTATATATMAPTAAPTAAPTNAPTAKPKPTPTQNPLAIGLCPAAQLQLTITSWQNSGDSYAHVTATNVSSATCNMRGSSRAQILDGHHNVIADAGASAAKVSSSDPVYPLAPNGTINTIVDWGNWCKSAPAQNVSVQMVLAFGLGTIRAPAIGPAPIPSCYVSSQKTSLSSEAWLP
jgi:hypothetical protein